MSDVVRPFVDYYAQNDISPVQQDISDLAKHFERRASLYRLLGIAPIAVCGRRVLEFGPGSGHNALYTASLGPAEYVLVDANPRGIAETRTRLHDRYGDRVAFEVVDSLVEDYRADAPFDLVLAENLVPFQRDPAAFARTIADFTAPGGILVMTCIDAVSHLSEIGRRLIAHRIAPPSLPLRERVERLKPVFAPHAATLAAMTRSLEDWILDNITHPLVGRTFSIPEAIAALGDGFDVFGSSPRFMTEWRWYKALTGDAARPGAAASDAYFAHVANVLDYRVTLPSHDPQAGRAIAACCDDIYAAMQAIEASETFDMTRVLPCFARLEMLVAPISPSTAASIRELTRVLEAPSSAPPETTSLPSFFGRGTQYISFVRREAKP